MDVKVDRVSDKIKIWFPCLIDIYFLLFFIIFLIDTAAVYRNEDCIGELLPGLLSKFGLKREDVFITSKLGKCPLSEINAQLLAVYSQYKNYVCQCDINYFFFYFKKENF